MSDSLSRVHRQIVQSQVDLRHIIAMLSAPLSETDRGGCLKRAAQAVGRLQKAAIPLSEIPGSLLGRIGGEKTVPSIPLTDQPALTYVYDAAFQHLFRWARKGVAPPQAARIRTNEDASDSAAKPTVALDEYGNGLGGVRTPYVEVPAASYLVTSPGPGTCAELGHMVALDHSRLTSLYADAKAYASKVKQAVDRLVKEGWLTESDGRKIESELNALPTH